MEKEKHERKKSKQDKNAKIFLSYGMKQIVIYAICSVQSFFSYYLYSREFICVILSTVHYLFTCLFSLYLTRKC